MSGTNPTLRWLAVHDSALYAGDAGIHDPAKDSALLAALEPVAAVALSGAVLDGGGFAAAEERNAAARQALQEYGSTSKAFQAALKEAPVTGLAMVTGLARVAAGFQPATSPPASAQFNALTGKLGTLPLLFLTSSISLTANTATYATEEDAIEGTVDLLPIALPAPQRAALAALVAEQAETAREEGRAGDRKLALYLFQITAADEVGFSLYGSTWSVGATCERQREGKKRKVAITVALRSGVVAVFRWVNERWVEAVPHLAPSTTVLPTLQAWVEGYSTPTSGLDPAPARPEPGQGAEGR